METANWSSVIARSTVYMKDNSHETAGTPNNGNFASVSHWPNYGHYMSSMHAFVYTHMHTYVPHDNGTRHSVEVVA